MNASHTEDDCPQDLIPTRKSLLGRLRDWEDNESWRDFFETYWRLIYGFAVRRGLSHEEAQEAVQETVIAVARSIGRFEYDPNVCAFKTWLLRVTGSKIANQFAKRERYENRQVRHVDDDSQGTRLSDRMRDEKDSQWDQAWDTEWRKNLMEAAIQRVKRRVSIEQYQMFDLFVLKEWPALEVARTLGVTIAHVYVSKHRIAKLIRKEVDFLETRGF